MTELRGLQAIINTGTLHGIEEPPKREDYPVDSPAFERAYDDWWVRTTFWAVSKATR